MHGRELLLDIDGKGRLPMIPLSQTTFSVRLVNVDLVRDQRGVVTHLVNILNGARFLRHP